MSANSKNRSRQWWQSKIEEWRETGLSIVTFCKQRGINYQTFYKWKHTLKNELQQCGLKKSLSSNRNSPSNAFSFVELNPRTEHHSAIEIESPTGWKIRVHSDVDTNLLTSMMTALERLS